MLLKCVRKFPPTVNSTVNINTVQYPTQYKQCEIPTVPAVVICKVLLPQFSTMVVFVRSNSCRFSYSSPYLPRYKNFMLHNLQYIHYDYFDVLRLLHKVSQCQHKVSHCQHKVSHCQHKVSHCQHKVSH